MTMLGTCYLLSKTSLSHNDVQNSLNTIYATVRPRGVTCEIESGIDHFETEEATSGLDAVSSIILASLSSTDNDSQVKLYSVCF